VISAIVFDFDGVLVDSEPLHLRAYQEVLEPLGLSLPREKYYASYLGYDDPGVFRAVAEARDWPLDDQKLGALIEEKCRVFDELVSEGAGGDVMYAGAAECVARLAAEWPLGIASGAARPEIETMLRRRGLDRYFRFIVASGDTPASKPAPDPYRKAAALHGHPPEACVAIEDSRWGIESAKQAGLWCIGITHTYPVSELLQADAIVTSLGELTPELIRTLK
jgi:beta-phosphoglucomutase